MYWPVRRNFPGLSWPLPPLSVSRRILRERAYVAPDSVVEMEVQSLEKSLAGSQQGRSRRYESSKERALFACPTVLSEVTSFLQKELAGVKLAS